MIGSFYRLFCFLARCTYVRSLCSWKIIHAVSGCLRIEAASKTTWNGRCLSNANCYDNYNVFANPALHSYDSLLCSVGVRGLRISISPVIGGRNAELVPWFDQD